MFPLNAKSFPFQRLPTCYSRYHVVSLKKSKPKPKTTLSEPKRILQGKTFADCNPTEIFTLARDASLGLYDHYLYTHTELPLPQLSQGVLLILLKKE